MKFEWTDFLIFLRVVMDVIGVWALIYGGIQIIRSNNRTIQIVKGILALFLIKMAATILKLSAVTYLLDIFLNWSVILVLIILQPEIRSLLEKMGQTNVLFTSGVSRRNLTSMVDQLVMAVENMSKTKTGALITVEMGQSLQDYEKTGIPMDSDVTTELLETIFQYGTPMHDGAVIIEGDKVACAAAYFPTTTKDLPSKYGARHRAAVGISEVTDSITIIVSEETGGISVAQKGDLTHYNPEALRRLLNQSLGLSDQDRTSAPPVIETKHVDNPARHQQQKKDDRVQPIEVIDLRTAKGEGQ
ncbi:MAG: TIGR00159 family protein [Erysipelotrichaceae bacterium]|nr:TIGR00159 family protein [Erysipelotrichaceae bacterium]